jgi:hypothetical protein
MRPTSTGDECEMNIHHRSPFVFIERHRKKVTTENQQASEETPWQTKKERYTEKKPFTLASNNLICRFSYHASVFSQLEIDAVPRIWRDKKSKQFECEQIKAFSENWSSCFLTVTDFLVNLLAFKWAVGEIGLEISGQIDGIEKKLI